MLPKISIVTPTLNAQKVIKPYLEAIKMQSYPKELVEIIIADGGSVDETVKLAKDAGAVVVPNPLKTAESGKVVGIKKAVGDFIVQIDSDNILPTKNWLKEMVNPLIDNPIAVASEPWEYTWRKKDGFITRYCALIGMNDPLVHFLGNYDRKNLLTGKWTEIHHEEKDLGNYLLVRFKKEYGLPTVGANGVCFRADFLKSNLKGDYLFDIDMLSNILSEKGEVIFVKVKNGIVHTYCESSIIKFAKKQRRRVRDFLFHKSEGSRSYDWGSQGSFLKTLKFIIYCIGIIPLFIQAVYGYTKKHDIAWFFHPLACWITLWEYGTSYILSFFKKEELNRKSWSQ